MTRLVRPGAGRGVLWKLGLFAKSVLLPQLISLSLLFF